MGDKRTNKKPFNYDTDKYQELTFTEKRLLAQRKNIPLEIQKLIVEDENNILLGILIDNKSTDVEVLYSILYSKDVLQSQKCKIIKHPSMNKETLIKIWQDHRFEMFKLDILNTEKLETKDILNILEEDHTSYSLILLINKYLISNVQVSKKIFEIVVELEENFPSLCKGYTRSNLIPYGVNVLENPDLVSDTTRITNNIIRKVVLDVIDEKADEILNLMVEMTSEIYDKIKYISKNEYVNFLLFMYSKEELCIPEINFADKQRKTHSYIVLKELIESFLDSVNEKACKEYCLVKFGFIENRTLKSVAVKYNYSIQGLDYRFCGIMKKFKSSNEFTKILNVIKNKS